MKREFNTDISLAAIVLACSLAAGGLTGCSGQSTGGTESTQESTGAGEDESTEAGSETESGDNSGAQVGDIDYTDVKNASGVTSETDADGNITMTAQLGEDGEKKVTFDALDLDDNYDVSAAVKVNFNADGTVDIDGSTDYASLSSDGKTLTLKSGGIYVLSGSMQDGQVVIDGEDAGNIQLVLDGFTVENKSDAPIVNDSKCKVLITLADGSENTVTDGRIAADEDDASDDSCTDGSCTDEGSGTDSVKDNDKAKDKFDAAVYSKGDLSINGSGKLTVTGGYASGVLSKGKLTIISGDISVDAADHGLKGKDAVLVRDGDLDIKAVGDGIKAKNEDDAEAGYIWIEGGTIDIEADDDGIQASGANIICGGTLNLNKCEEGLAGKTVDVLGGVINATCSDDAINSAMSVDTEEEKMRDQDGVYTRIAGGYLTLDAEADGIDSNGDLYMEGGVLHLSGPVMDMDGTLDYNGGAEISGGTVIAAGSSGMFQTFAGSGNDKEEESNIETRSGDENETKAGDESETAAERGTETEQNTDTAQRAGGGEDFKPGARPDGGFGAGFGSNTDAVSTQNHITIFYEEQQEAGTLITVKDGAGNEIDSYAPAKAFSSVIISSPDFKTGDTVTVITGDDEQEIEITDILTQVGEMKGFGGNPGGMPGGGAPGGMGGAPGEAPEGQENAPEGRGGQGFGGGRGGNPPDGKGFDSNRKSSGDTGTQQDNGTGNTDSSDSSDENGRPEPPGGMQMPDGTAPSDTAAPPNGMTPPDGDGAAPPDGKGGMQPPDGNKGMTPPDGTGGPGGGNSASEETTAGS